MGPYLQVGGHWFMKQTNGALVDLTVEQDKDKISAFATHKNGRVRSLSAKGHVNGPKFYLKIEWDDHTLGEYKGDWKPNRAGFPGSIPDGGYLEGFTQDLKHLDVTANWTSEGKVFYIR